jgi:hypothetical protein
MAATALFILIPLVALGWLWLLVRASPARTRKVSAGIFAAAGCIVWVWVFFWAHANRSSYYSSAVAPVGFLIGMVGWMFAGTVLWALFHFAVALAKRSDEYLESGVYAFCLLAIAAGVVIKEFIH